MKRKISLFLAAVMAVSALAGCGEKSKEAANGEAKTYSLFAHNWQVYDGQENDRI